MFIILYAGKFYGPFATADQAAIYAEAIEGPWQIVVLRDPEVERCK